ncbi:MAG: hypothetical protein Tsb005_18870 [Gammaproteobacteria bacterium]
MGKTLQEKLNKLSKKRQHKIHQRAQELILEKMTLRDLRLALQKTQVEVAQKLHMQQDGISRLEHRSDMLLSTLYKYIAAMGGSVKTIVEFPNRPPVQLTGFAEFEQKAGNKQK